MPSICNQQANRAQTETTSGGTWHIYAIYTNNLPPDGVPSHLVATAAVLRVHPPDGGGEWLSQANEIKSPSPRSTVTVLIIIMTMTSPAVVIFYGIQPRNQNTKKSHEFKSGWGSLLSGHRTRPRGIANLFHGSNSQNVCNFVSLLPPPELHYQTGSMPFSRWVKSSKLQIALLNLTLHATIANEFPMFLLHPGHEPGRPEG